MANFIFIGCRKRQGKDVVADYLMNGLNLKHDYLAFKGSCIEYGRNFVEDLLPSFSRHDAKDEGVEEYNNRTYRETVISVVDAVLKCDKLAFAKHLVENATDKDEVIYIIPDCRRLEEVEYFKSALGDKAFFVNVVRPGIEIDTNAYGEGSLDDYDWDHVVHNDGTLKELKSKTDDLINIIHERLQKTNKAKEMVVERETNSYA